MSTKTTATCTIEHDKETGGVTVVVAGEGTAYKIAQHLADTALPGIAWDRQVSRAEKVLS